MPHLPPRANPHPRGGGRKPKDDRVVFEGILFVLRFGCQWNVLDAIGMCPSSTVHDRFKKWTRAGLFHRLREAGLLEREALRHVDWSWLSPEGSLPAASRRAEPPKANSRQERGLRTHSSAYQRQDVDAKG